MTQWDSTQTEVLSRYLDDELAGAERAAVDAQLAADPALRQQLEEMRTARLRLLGAVAAQAVPARLEAQVLEKTTRRRWAGFVFSPASLQFAAAMAIMLLLVVAGWQWTRTPEYQLSDLPAEVAAIMEIGIGKHVSCVKERLGSTVFGMGKFQSKVPDEYQRMIDAARQAIPADFQVVEIHMCGTPKRQFAHLVVARGDHYLSLLLTTRQQGDPMPADPRFGVAQVDGIDIYAARTQDGMEVGAFALPAQYAFVVSDLDAATNVELSRKIAAAIN